MCDCACRILNSLEKSVHCISSDVAVSAAQVWIICLLAFIATGAGAALCAVKFSKPIASYFAGRGGVTFSLGVECFVRRVLLLSPNHLEQNPALGQKSTISLTATRK